METTCWLHTWESFLNYCLWAPERASFGFPPVSREMADLGKTCCPRLSQRVLYSGFHLENPSVRVQCKSFRNRYVLTEIKVGQESVG